MLTLFLATVVFQVNVERLQGDWLMIERHYPNGSVRVYPKGEQTIDHFNIYIQGDKATVHHDWTDPDDTIDATFSFVGSNGIVFTVTGSTIGGVKKGEMWESLYKFDGDTLVICEAGLGGKRPTEFKAAEGVYLYKFKKAKKP